MPDMVQGIDLFFSLFNNLAIFIALVAVYRYLVLQFKKTRWYRRQIVLGLSFGVFAVAVMYARIPVYEGVIVDQRVQQSRERPHQCGAIRWDVGTLPVCPVGPDLLEWRVGRPRVSGRICRVRFCQRVCRAR